MMNGGMHVEQQTLEELDLAQLEQVSGAGRIGEKIRHGLTKAVEEVIKHLPTRTDEPTP